MKKKLTPEEIERKDNAKKELREYRENITYLQEKQEDTEKIRAFLEKTTTRLSKTGISGGSTSADKFSDGLSRLEKIEKDKNKKLAELLIKKFVVEEKIDRMEYPHRDVLFLRYCRVNDWQEIADKLKYDKQYIFELHGEALLLYANL